MDEDDDTNHFDVNMQQIMSRFNTFNSLLSQSSSGDDDDNEEVEEEEDVRAATPGDEDQIDLQRDEAMEEDEPLTAAAFEQRPFPQAEEPVRVEVSMPEEETLKQDFVDASYWGNTSSCEDSLEDMMADYD